MSDRLLDMGFAQDVLYRLYVVLPDMAASDPGVFERVAALFYCRAANLCLMLGKLSAALTAVFVMPLFLCRWPRPILR